MYKTGCLLIPEKSYLKEALPSRVSFWELSKTHPVLNSHPFPKVLPMYSLPLWMIVQTKLCCLSLKFNCLCGLVTISQEILLSIKCSRSCNVKCPLGELLPRNLGLWGTADIFFSFSFSLKKQNKMFELTFLGSVLMQCLSKYLLSL